MLVLFALLLVGVVAVEPVYLGDLPMENKGLFEGDIILRPRPRYVARSGAPYLHLRWPYGRIPYVIDRRLWTKQKAIIGAMNEYHKKTCIRFIPRTTERDYIRIYKGKGCSSGVGKWVQGQLLSLGEGCYSRGIILHELGHAIGFYHEHKRSDRDKYLRVHWGNIRKGFEEEFIMKAPRQNILYTAFDYQSIMLYGETAFSKDGRSKTLTAKNGARLLPVYKKTGLSKSDAEDVNRMYRCRRNARE
uniref:Metalloendopeptidase n=1 Tax=Hemiscorpius lepturus TaxID=520031 RepID=A0A1L4BJ79_HEMLE|nr:venom toxin [Hemiscorpius lepturus]API81361.1 venom toxin [Hemiscorpius lepturus]